MTQTADTEALTPLHDLMRDLGGRMVPFAGYSMPLNFAPGILQEHLHCRAAAALFDVSHMGQVTVRAADGSQATAAAALEALLPGDIEGLAPGRQCYSLLTSDSGGILDDLMIANLGDRFVLVVNAANKAADLAHLQAALGSGITAEMIPDRALIALQGPAAAAALGRLSAEAPGMAFLDCRDMALDGIPCTVSRSGYTGEDGYEISVPADRAVALARALLADPAVNPAGLGARDTLRLEAGLCLHGADIGPDTTPVEAGLSWTIPRVRRPGGARPGGFPGAGTILSQIAAGPDRRRVGLRPDGRAPVRGGAPLCLGDTDLSVGEVTSGGFGPSLGAPVAMGYVRADLATPGTALTAELRGKRLPITVARLPFVPPHTRKP
jgi:aminomethyltransferase